MEYILLNQIRNMPLKILALFLKRFRLHDALRFIGELSYEIRYSQYKLINGVPISDGILAYISMRLIEVANDYRNKTMVLDDVIKACDMYYGMTDPIENDNDGQSFLMRFGAVQFDYDREMKNLISRTLCIYDILWKVTAAATNVDVENAIKKLSGLALHEILIFSLAFSGQSKKGYFRIYDDPNSGGERVADIFKSEKQERFANWISCSYKEFRVHSHREFKEIPDKVYEKHRFNPLLKYPAVIPDCNPSPGSSQVYILPIWRLLLEKVTRGLYFELSDYFRGPGRKNFFRTAFGFVFQEYVGTLLKTSIDKRYILAEWQYGKPVKKTPDWILLKDNRMVLIEVKQSGLYINSKKWGNLSEIQNDLRNSISKGVIQLWKFEKDLRSGNYYELETLTNVIEIERVIVTYDRSYFSNSIIRKQVEKTLIEDNSNITSDFHWHTISVEEFEYIISDKEADLFSFLNEKRIDSRYDLMDFRDYHSKINPEGPFSNRYLDKIWDGFFSDYFD